METKPFVNLFKEEELLEARRRPVYLVKSFQRNWDLLLSFTHFIEEELEPTCEPASRGRGGRGPQVMCSQLENQEKLVVLPRAGEDGCLGLSREQVGPSSASVLCPPPQWVG